MASIGDGAEAEAEGGYSQRTDVENSLKPSAITKIQEWVDIS